MKYENISQYLNDEFKETLKPISELSKNNKKTFIESDFRMYDFDLITEKLYPKKQSSLLTSIDCVTTKNKKLFFIEFKTGFKKNLRRDNLDDRKYCDMVKDEKYFCEKYWDLFFRKQEMETKELINSLKFKAIETNMTYKNEILKNIKKSPTHISYIIVIDEMAIDSIENALTDLSKKTTTNTKNNIYNKIENSLKKYYNVCIYNEIKVISKTEFENNLNNGIYGESIKPD